MTARTDPPALDEASDDAAALVAVCNRLGRADIEPLSARALLITARRRLAHDARVSSRVARYEPLLLALVSAAHLVWALARVFVFTH